MSAADYSLLWLMQMVMQIPLLVVASIGLRATLAHRSILGHVSRWAFWGFGLLIGYAFAHVALRVVLMTVPVRLAEEGFRMTAGLSLRISLWQLAAYPLLIGGIAVLAYALFLGRSSFELSESGNQVVGG